MAATVTKTNILGGSGETCEEDGRREEATWDLLRIGEKTGVLVRGQAKKRKTKEK